MAVYLDDIVVSGRTWEEAWEKTITTLRRLVEAGFMINGTKCHLLTDKLEVVGHEVADGRYRPREKKLLALFTQAIPTTHKEVQALVGRLNYYKRFVANYQ